MSVQSYHSTVFGITRNQVSDNCALGILDSPAVTSGVPAGKHITGFNEFVFRQSNILIADSRCPVHLARFVIVAVIGDVVLGICPVRIQSNSLGAGNRSIFRPSYAANLLGIPSGKRLISGSPRRFRVYSAHDFSQHRCPDDRLMPTNTAVWIKHDLASATAALRYFNGDRPVIFGISERDYTKTVIPFGILGYLNLIGSGSRSRYPYPAGCSRI